jgi:dihydroxy-acid dehydratase
MEAYNGGPIAAIRNGDVIEIDIPKRSLNVRLSDEVLKRRLQDTRPPDRDLTPLLRTYREKYTGINCYGK